MSFAYDTRISVEPGSDRPIQSFITGDPVLAASLRPGEAPAWEGRPVGFSAGAPPGESATVILVSFDDGDPSLVCTLDQPLVRADGLIVPAERLARGDALMRPDGGARPVAALVVGRSAAGVHAIAAAGEWSGSPDGHLLAANGIVAGDYLLQVHHGSDE